MKFKGVYYKEVFIDTPSLDNFPDIFSYFYSMVKVAELLTDWVGYTTGLTIILFTLVIMLLCVITNMAKDV